MTKTYYHLDFKGESHSFATTAEVKAKIKETNLCFGDYSVEVVTLTREKLVIMPDGDDFGFFKRTTVG